MGQIPENLESVTVEWLLTLVQHDKEMDGEDITHIAHRQVGVVESGYTGRWGQRLAGRAETRPRDQAGSSGTSIVLV